MNILKTNPLLRHLRHIAANHDRGDAPDQELLERFLLNQNEEAFTTLLRRHGPMVLAVCRSIVGDWHLAEDAFQATFLLLAKRAQSIQKRAAVGCWLHGVARHVALKARETAARQRVSKERSEPMTSPDPLLDMSLRELQTILHEELGQLPEKYRAPVVLCYLEGKTHAQAALQLGWTAGTVRGRVNRGREMLRGRLTRRGLAVPAALLTTALATNGPSLALSAGLVHSTARAALATAAGQATATELVSAEVASLVKGGISAFSLSKLTLGAALVLTLGLIGMAAGTIASSALLTKPAEIVTDRTAPTEQLDGKNGDPHGQLAKDLYGDPLPTGSVARLGTVSLRHGEGIQSIAISPDGKLLACAADSRFISLWDRSTGKQIRPIQGGGGQTLAFSPDGRLLATAGGKNVEVWDVAAGKRLRQLPFQTFTEKGNSTFQAREVPLVFSADGRLLASANADHVVMIWDAASGEELARTSKQENPIAYLRFLPDLKMLVSLSGDRQIDGAVQFWEVATGKELSKVVIPAKETGTRPLAISPDGKTVAVEALVEVREKHGAVTSVYLAHCIRLHDAATGRQLLHIQGKNSVVENVVFSPDGRFLAWTNMDNEVTVWDTIADKLIYRFRQAAGGSTGGSYAIAYDPAGKMLATSSQGSAVHLWDLVAGKELLDKEAHGSAIHAVVHSPDGRTIASASADQTIRTWNAKTGKHIAKLTGHEGPIYSIAFSPEGRQLATAASDRTVRLWDAATGRELHRFTLPDIDLGNGTYQIVVRTVAFAPDGQTLIASGSDLKVHRWEVNSGKECHQQSWRLDAVSRSGEDKDRYIAPPQVYFSPDGRTAAATTQKAIHLVDVVSGHEFTKLEGDARPGSLAFSADSRVLVTGGWNKVLCIWEAASGKKIREIKLPDYINSVAASPDGRLVAAGCGWNPAGIHVFEVVSGTEVLAFAGLTAYIGALDFSPRGLTLVSGQRDTTGLIWDVSLAYRHAQVVPKELDAARLEKLWIDLGSEDAAKANAAAWLLTSSPQSVPAFLKDRLPPVPRVTVDKLQQLIADLDARAYAKRQSASQALANLGSDGHAELGKALTGKVSPEVRRRIEALLKGPTRFVPTSAQLRRIRTIGVLERIDSQEAVAILRSVAEGAPAAPETQEAMAVLRRLSKHGATANKW